MDKKMTNLDPKLKEIYDRVMSTTIAPGQLTNQPPQTNSTVKGPPAAPVATPLQAVPNSPPSTPQPSTTAPVTQPQPVSPNRPFVTEYVNPGKKGIPTSMLIVCVVIFFVIYALVWIKLFNVSLPFEIPFITS